MFVTLRHPTPLYRIRDGVYAPDLLVVAVAEFDLFSWLAAHGPASLAGICAQFELDPRPADVLATYCTALGLLDRDGDAVANTELAAQHLTAGAPHDLRAYYASLAQRPACAELSQVLHTGRPAAWASGRGDPDWADRLDEADFARSFTAAMDARGAFLGPALAAALDDLEMQRVLDVGGGSGIYLRALLDRRPGLRGSVLERPPVDTAARALLADSGHADQVEVVAGDMFSAPLPTGHDVHLYSHVLHDWDADRARQLLAASSAALPPGGWLVDHDAHVDADKRGPLPVAEYSVLLMHSTPGKCWSAGEIGDLARQAGFAGVIQRPTAGDRSVLLARKPY